MKDYREYNLYAVLKNGRMTLVSKSNMVKLK